ncbi:G protein-regulated inducer of neurite outgrowth 3 [Merluccius polli]|uniref:G protein-regulated inducer of neurite outgrowth 3 n=1 Tax=Merluccius polli TaxID=89951 RepID=A0AA47MC22_MERPO|nr:G protein-regulated inducer of neurite outgrowth 3 [Merluccius polli]
MGTNPKRTVTVQMVAQLAEVDPLGNKEPDAKQTTEPNLNQSQVCPASTTTTTTASTTTTTTTTSIPSPDHTDDILHAAPTKNTPNSQLSSKEGAPVGIVGSDVPAPANGNQEIFPLIGDKTHHQTTAGSSLTGRGVSTPAEGPRDDHNATLRMRSPEKKEEQGISKAGVTSDVAASKVDTLTNDCRARGPIAPVERSSEPPLQGGETSTVKESPSGNAGNYAPCNNQRLGMGFESERTGSEVLTPQPESQRGVLSTAACPGPASTVLESKVPANINSLVVVSSSVVDKSPSQKQCLTPVSKTETVTLVPVQTAAQKTQAVVPPPPAMVETTVVPRTTKPPTASQGQSAGATDLNSNLTHAERGPPPAYNTRIASDKHQPTPSQPTPSQPTPSQPTLSQRGSCAAPQALEDKPACGQVAEKVGTTGATAVPGPSTLHPKRYSEASTMTSGSSTPTKQCQDVEVQAVAYTCSRAVSTSPSLLPLGAVHRPSGGVPLPQDEAQSLAVLYKAEGGGGSGPGLLHHQTGPSQIYIDSIACTVDASTEGLVVEAGTCGDRNAKAATHTEGDRVATKPKQDNPAASHVQTAAPPLKPVYQINIEHSTQREGKMAAVAHPTVSSQSAKPSKPTLSDPPVMSAAETPTTKASSSHVPPSQGPASANKPKQADDNPTAAQPQSANTTKPGQAASIPANSNSKSKVSKAGAECPKDQPKPGGKASAKEVRVGKSKSLEQERKKKEEEEEGDDDDEKQKGKGVHEVVWDEQGMTWEVYGAGVDPESLGFAIQSHLQCKIKEQERKLFTKTSQRKSIVAATADSPRRERKKQRRRQNIFRSMLRNVRRPHCCSRPSPASVLE